MKRTAIIRSLIFLVCIFASAFSYGQDFTIETVNTSMFPTINLRVRPTPARQLERAGIGIMDHGQTVDFTLEAGQDSGKAGTARAVCFLVETSRFISAAQLAAVKSVIDRQLRGLTDGTAVNICYYSRSKNSSAISRISPEFTSDYNMLMRDMNSRMTLSSDTTPRVDLYKALYETMEFMGSKKGMPAHREIILISTGNNNGSSPVNLTQCITKAQDLNIAVDGVGMRSYSNTAADNIKGAATEMSGTYRAAASEGEIDAAVNGFLAQDEKLRAAGAISGDTYNIRYNCPVKNASDGEVTVTMGGVTRNASYTVNGKNKAAVTGSGSNTWLYILCALALAGIVIPAVIMQTSKKEKAKQEQLAATGREEAKRQEAIAAQQRQAEEERNRIQSQQQQQAIAPAAIKLPPTPATPAYDPHRTVVSGMKLPQLTVMNNGQRQSYPLTQASYTIGRNAGNGIVIQNPTLSGVHATISLEHGAWYITDNNSTNGTFVNGQRITKTLIQPGMQIAMGQVACLFE